MIEQDAPLREAISVMGSRRALGRKIGISHQAIDGWRRVPAERVLEVERATGISRKVLRPDLFDGPSPPKDQQIQLRISDAALETVCRRAASRAIHSLLAHDPDVLSERNVEAVQRQLGRLLLVEMKRATSQ
jgi:hypothetical protein